VKMEMHSRRVFLKYAGAAGIGAGLGGSFGAWGQAPVVKEVAIGIQPDAGPLAARVAAILKARIEERCAAKVVHADAGARILLAVDERLAPEAFSIEAEGEAVRIAGGTPRGLLYGAGKFLRTSRYGAAGFEASAWRGTSAPRGTLRGMYFATHFHNWYHQAPEAEIVRYMEELALWGVNAFMVILPMINLRDWDDPQCEPAMAMVRKYAACAHELGLQFATGINNTLFTGAPESIRAARLPDPLGRRGNSGHPVCPSNPEGHAYIMENTRKLFERLSDVGLDILVFWPYDEGGCACERCMPWGSNGYLRLSKEQARLGRSFFPGMKTVLSTWMFDTPPEGEWQGLADTLARENGWLDYILADAHEDFPRYPLDSGVPGKLPLLNFPEISMWGNSPWGGMGANPLPGRFQRLWNQVKPVVEGGFPYSEGIYEDVNKAAVVQFYWDPERSARATIEEYAAYEYGTEDVEDVAALVDLLEAAASQSYMKQPVDVAGVARAFELANRVDARLPEWGRRNWRWEILRLRALLDKEKYAGDGLETPAAEAALRRLCEIYHCQLETDDPYHHRVRPRLRGAKTRGKEL